VELQQILDQEAQKVLIQFLILLLHWAAVLEQKITQTLAAAPVLVDAMRQAALQLKVVVAVELDTGMLEAMVGLPAPVVELVVEVEAQVLPDQIPLAVLLAMVEMDVRSQYQVHPLPMLAVVEAVETHTAVAYLRELVEQAAAVLAV